MKKQRYIDIMDRAFLSYTKEQIEDYYERVKAEGLTEHGFPRLASNLGVLICHGRHKELLPLFCDLMDLCCEQMPKVHAANDFSVREIVTCIMAVEKAYILPKEKTGAWREAISSIDPIKCYDCVAQKPDQLIGNWSLFNAVSEYARVFGGFARLEDTGSYMDLQLATQIRLVDECGMYKDPHNHQPAYKGYVYPILYDYVPRALFAFLIHFGYEGEHRTAIEAALEKSAELTLKMQSVTGEIPFGGRSAQFMHNECTEAALLEFYASYYAKKGDVKKAGQFKRAARLAAESVFYWFDAAPMKHVKNRYSIESKVGCEAYAYFDKYMITAASMAYLAYLYADDLVDECETCPAIEGGFVARTSDEFHKCFLNKGGYFVEIETDADRHYEGSGIGRVQKYGAPPQICLSSGFADHPSYGTDGQNLHSLSLCSSCLKGERVYLGSQGVYTVDKLEADHHECIARLTCRMDGAETYEYITVSKSGVSLTACADADKVGIEVPVFAFDGFEKTHVKMTNRDIAVEYRGFVCKYMTDGEFFDVKEEICNRNGKYRRFRAVGEGKVSVRIVIEQI